MADEEGDGACGRCCCRPPLVSSVGGGCEGGSYGRVYMGLGGETKGRRGAVTFLVLGEEKFQPGRGRLKRKEEGLCGVG